MNFTPIQWLQIALANAFGQDKLTFDQRLGWADKTSFDTVASEAEEPAYALAIMDGLSGNNQVRVHLDATASG